MFRSKHGSDAGASDDDVQVPESATEDELPNQLSGVERRIAAQELRYRDNLWRSNYHEAAIFIEEGMNNDKFENHPQKRVIRKTSQNNEGCGAADHGKTTTPTVEPLVDNASHQFNHYGSISTSSECCATSSTNGHLINNNDNNNNSAYENMLITSPKKPHKQSSPINYNLLGGQFTTIETYILVHNRYFYQLDLLASLVLISLALFEPPAVPGLKMNTTIHAAVEMIALAIIGLELILKFRWMGPKRFFHHGRTVTKILVLSLMIIEAIVMASRQVLHARYSRALRPIFLIDNHYCNGIRRVVRQIFQSIPAIFDMFILAIFFLFVFSIFGFYLLAPHNNYFSDMISTVGNLLILGTTANMPDIILPSYAVSRWSAIYFVLFIILHLFLLTNLTMAAVYESFTRREKEKFHKLFLHRRKACQEAFKLLVSRKDPNHIFHRQFMGLMRYLNRNYTMFEAYLIFKALDTDKSGALSLDEFYQIYDFLKLDWKLIYPQVHWYDYCDNMGQWMKRIIAKMVQILKHRYFEWTIDGLIALTAAVQFLEATAFDFHLAVLGNVDVAIIPTNSINFTSINNTSPVINNYYSYNTTDNVPLSAAMQQQQQEEPTPDSYSTGIFISIFALEAAWRLIALGLSEYWASKWNRFDLIVLILSGSGFISGLIGGTPFQWVIVLRVLRLVRRFEFKRRYKDLWQTLTYILLKRFVSMVCVVMILYYFFAIIGMELMHEYNLRDCCKNTTYEVSFRYKPAGEIGQPTISAQYYLNDFTDLVNSYLTLFGMTGSTYWLAVMNAYTDVSQNQWLRLYFGLYYLCSIIVMNIVIAFILESFLFRIQYRNKMGDKCDDANLFTVTVSLSSSEVDFLYKNLRPSRDDKNFGAMNASMSHGRSRGPLDGCFGGRSYFIFQAEQTRNKFSFTLKMYADEVVSWLKEAERADQNAVDLMISRNQLRAEQVALARLLRRNLASNLEEQLAQLDNCGLATGLNHTRNRSYSSSGNPRPATSNQANQNTKTNQQHQPQHFPSQDA